LLCRKNAKLAMQATTSLSSTVLGYSTLGRPITGYWLGDVMAEGRLPEGAIEALYFGAIHGDEGLSSRLLEAFIRDIQQQSSGDWINQRVVIIPVMNPDGLAANTRVNANGVDLNRNYPTQNWTPALARHNDEQPEHCPGPTPASEVETRLLMDLIAVYPPKVIVSVHTPYRVINIDGPNGTTEALAQSMASINGYPVTRDIGYPTPGSFGNYYGVERGIPVLTLELHEDEQSCDFRPQDVAALYQVLKTPS
jgi:protein MpaA